MKIGDKVKIKGTSKIGTFQGYTRKGKVLVNIGTPDLPDIIEVYKDTLMLVDIIKRIFNFLKNLFRKKK